ncbi:MAG: hypothetical protein H7Y11_11085, partial [Armatimonadetes bacterium]|nr:hypothetical protein [Anaerolineae bacterium]
MMTITRSLTRLVLALLALGLVACAAPTPIPVFITPTPLTPTLAPTVVPTIEPLPTMTLESLAAGAPTTTPLVIGAVVGADYTLQPSTTPRATRTPLITIPPRPSDTAIPSGPPATPTVSPTPISKLDAQQVGVQLYINLGREEWDYSLARAKELGVTWVKVQASWTFLQPNGYNPSEEVLRTFELNLQTAHQYGFKILLSVAKAPPYMRSSQGDDAPPDDPQALADFLNMIFRETKIGEVVNAIEIWNEPNLRREWNSSVLDFSGAGYMRLFAPAYQAIQ